VKIFCERVAKKREQEFKERKMRVKEINSFTMDRDSH
jgi:hypothetical protein